MIRFFRRKPTITESASVMGKLGAAARHERERERYRARARQILEELGLEPDPRLC